MGRAEDRRHMRQARIGASRAHGRPMFCPACGNDIFLNEPHICKNVKQARLTGVLRFYGYNSTNQCCREWMLLGWPEESGYPKNRDIEHMKVECRKCGDNLYFDLVHPYIVFTWDTAERGQPDPPVIMAGRIRGRV